MTRILLFGGHYVDVNMPIDEVNETLIQAYQGKLNVTFRDARYPVSAVKYIDHIVITLSPEKVVGLVSLDK
jgi:hypothetical protein